MKDNKTSYRATPVPSPSMFNEHGYYNHFGGFHRTTDIYAYLGLLGLALKSIVKGQFKAASWILRRILWTRWIHRSCDTTDFHHDIYCLLDPWVQQREAEDRWTEVWTKTS